MNSPSYFFEKGDENPSHRPCELLFDCSVFNCRLFPNKVYVNPPSVFTPFLRFLRQFGPSNL